MSIDAPYPPPTAHDFPTGGRFVLRKKLGEGSMGAVFLAFDHERRVEIALKTLRRVDPTGIYRFKREFRAIADVLHPNLVVFHDLFQEGDLWYFTMEHVEGQDFLTYVLDATPSRLDPPTVRDRMAEGEHDRQDAATSDLEMLFPTPLRDEQRLRKVLVQVASGLQALHAAGRLHRDLKPDNVLVTRDGSAKLLDFGIAIELPGGIHHGTMELGVMGTPAYMSPEQAAGLPVDEATDWYALGVMLFEALTGQVPFDGAYFDVMAQKQERDPPRPSEVVSGVPTDLDELCKRLLQRNPALRPTGPSVLRSLEARTPPSIRPPPSSSVPSEADAPFVGRADEMAKLSGHLGQTDRGKPVVTLLHASSGLGKTTLAERFLTELRMHGTAVVLKGRCYEREAVPFKAFDSLVDALSRYLRRLLPAEAAEVLPRDVQALAQLFPVLRRVEAVANARRRSMLPADRQALRARAFAALRELFCRMADRAPLVLFIDDVQWGDVDSANLMAELVRGPEVPALFVILAYRRDEAESSAYLRTLLPQLRTNEELELHELALGPLSEQESVELAASLLGDGRRVAALGIGLESHGNPHLLAELARHVLDRRASGEASADTDRGIVTYEHALARRLSDLSLGARTLLELLSVAGRPMPEESLSLLCASLGVELQVAVLELRGHKLVRGVGSGERRSIETYHDRVREAVLATVAADRVEALHRRLASTLEATGSDDLEAIVDHLLGARDYARAQIYAIRAATQAAEALAFEKAARLFAIAVEHQHDEGWGHELLVRWADALVNAGHGRAAASVYFDAARATIDPEASVLRRKAGLLLLSSGHESEAVELLQGTLEAYDVSIPGSRDDARQALEQLSQRLHRRGLAFDPRPAAALPASRLERLDTLFSLALATVLSDVERGLPLVVRALLEALDAGEPERVVSALCLFHSLVDAPSHFAKGSPLMGALAIAEALDGTLGSELAHARVLRARATDALAVGEVRVATRHLHAAEELYRTRCPGTASEMRHCRTLLGYVFASSCQVERLQSMTTYLREAEEHEDLLAATRFRMLSMLTWLAADQADQAERELLRTATRIGIERRDLTFVLHELASMQLALYRDDATQAAELMANAAVRTTTLSAVPFIRAGRLLWQSRALLLAARAPGADVAVRLFEADENLSRLDELALPGFDARVRLLRAAAASMRGDVDAALTAIERVLGEQNDAPDGLLVRAAAERRKGELLRGEAGILTVARSDARLREQGVHDPRAFVRLFVPELDAGV
jgi:serine/threonine protein kinase